MSRYCLLNANKTNQLINMPLDKHLFKPVDSITDHICTVVSLSTGDEVDESNVHSQVEALYNSTNTQKMLTINGTNYFLVFVD